MSRIRSKDTLPERIVRLFLWHNGIRYRKNVRKLPGTPDIVIHKLRTVVFVQGCFWHGHSTHLRMPKSNVEFWERKIERNRQRDASNRIALEAEGWKVLTVWECQLTKARREETLRRLLQDILSYPSLTDDTLSVAAEPSTPYLTLSQTGDGE